MAATTKAMRELLERKGIAPTGDADQDMALAKLAMPPPFNKSNKDNNND
tara:strand:- start:9579 stop:9725 length:147 start_codon:yes stop_codon:yes gene_type:complete